VVFTLPVALHPLVLHHPRRLYDLLFQAASQTLLTLAADPKRLGAQIGLTAILHTWGQNLLFHPHLHCVVTGGGLGPDGSRWIATRPGYLLPVKVLARLFRGKFLARVKEAYHAGELCFAGRRGGPGGAGGLSPLARRLVSSRLGRLCQAALRRFFIVHTSNILGKKQGLLSGRGC
jgi:hypothetical protein